MTQNQPGGVAALAAQLEQILVQTPRHIEFAAVLVMERLPIGDLQKLRGRVQLLPQFASPGKGSAGLGCRQPLDEAQRHAEGAAKFEFLPPTFRVVRQQHQLVQRLLELRGRFGQRRTGRGFSSGFAPIEYGSLSLPGFAAVARQDLGLAVHQFREMHLERRRDPAVQLPPGIAQQTAIGRFLHKRVLEGIDGVGWCPGLKHQLRRDEAIESGLQLALGKTGDRAQQRIAEPASERRTDAKRSSRAISDACRLVGIASGGKGPSST